MVNLALVGPSKHSIRDAYLKTEMESKEKIPRRLSKHDLENEKSRTEKISAEHTFPFPIHKQVGDSKREIPC